MVALQIAFLPCRKLISLYLEASSVT